MSEAIPVSATEPTPLLELTDAEKLEIRNIQYSFYLLRIQQEHLQQQAVNVSQLLQQKESDLLQKYGMNVNRVVFDRDALCFRERQL